MTQFLLSVHHREGDPMPSDTEMQQMYASVDAFNTKLQSSGAWVLAGGLTDVTEAKVVDASAGATRAVTDGPFSEAREWLGGFWIIEAADLDAALALAQEGSAACHGPVEVRALQGA
ncbi:YciI family protein [Terrabacter carboxydivorans]|uniref:YciI family protein n=1 Tax=Terrabacter carboxydivorans TaxID=619730 RepID=A0ABN3KTX8_9MICO